ncbi:HAD family hydrolase [Mycolicibacterium bacteremicum]|uniref:HAD family hydrolase n=1 Tax=Mycolicibacterium bacteremicum TaxID=564198 RepID=UPI0026EF4D0A|nr:HAD family hydrolase [Mycolicibacterium bacteremicum]
MTATDEKTGCTEPSAATATYLFRNTDPLRAVIFDLDALTDLRFDGYRAVFNAAFAALNLPLHWSVDRYRRLLALPDERLRVAAELRKHCVGTECDVLVDLLVDEICATKDMMFDEMILDAGLPPRAGLCDLITDAFVADVPICVVTDGRRRWAQPLVHQLVGAGLVEAVVTADDIGVPPDGTALFRHALAELGIGPRDALVVVGSARGLRAADTAGLATVLIDADAEQSGPRPAVAVRTDYAGAADALRLSQCRRLHTQWWDTHTPAAA